MKWQRLVNASVHSCQYKSATQVLWEHSDCVHHRAMTNTSRDQTTFRINNTNLWIPQEIICYYNREELPNKTLWRALLDPAWPFTPSHVNYLELPSQKHEIVDGKLKPWPLLLLTLTRGSFDMVSPSDTASPSEELIFWAFNFGNRSE